MPSFDAYEKDINAQNNTANTHEEMKNLVNWYGSALRQFVESGTTDGKNPLAKVTAGKITKQDKAKIQGKLSAFLGKSNNATVGGNVTPYCGKQRKNFEKKAKIDEDDAIADVQAGDDDEASEMYVDAAIARFRSAMCIYHQNSLGTPIFANQPIRQAAQDYAAALIKAAQLLNDAATHEDTGDILEIIGECILAKAFLDLTSAMLNQLQTSGALLNPEKPGVTAALNQTTAAQTAADTTLTPHVK